MADSPTARSRQCTADRQRRHRDRERGGRIILPIEVDEAALAVALVDAGFISVNDQDDRHKLAAALERVIEIIITDLSTFRSRVTIPQS